VKLSRFSAPGYASRKIRHCIPKPFLDIFQEPQRKNSSDSISSGLGSLNTVDTRSSESKKEFPVKIELVSAKFSRLDPSPLPAPSGYYAGTSSSGTNSEYSYSTLGASNLQRDGFLMHRASSLSTLSDYPSNTDTKMDLTGKDHGSQDTEDKEGDSNDESSMDILADARARDPEAIAVQEEDFEREQRREDRLGSSAASAVDDSGSPSSRSYDDEDEDMY
jgi:Frequency clock protein